MTKLKENVAQFLKNKFFLHRFFVTLGQQFYFQYESLSFVLHPSDWMELTITLLLAGAVITHKKMTATKNFFAMSVKNCRACSYFSVETSYSFG